MFITCAWEWYGPDIKWVEAAPCSQGTCAKPGYDGTTIGEIAYMPCGVE